MQTYLCVSIDCECDKGPGWRVQKPLAFEGIQSGIRNRLQPVFRHFQAKPTYLLSPEIMRDGVCVETLTGLRGEAEFGTHLHGEFAAPGSPEPSITSAFQRDYDRDTEYQKLRYLTDLFRAAFGRAPLSFRAGRFGIGPHSLPLLKACGYAVDSSVTPHMDWTQAGAPGLSFRQAPSQPYWPEPATPEIAAASAPAPGAVLEVPVTIRPSLFASLPVVGRRMEPRWLRPTRGSLRRLLAVAREEIASARSFGHARPIVLNCMFHNVEIVPGASPYAQNEPQAKAILDRLAGLLAFAKREGIRVIGLGDVPELFDAANGAGPV